MIQPCKLGLRTVNMWTVQQERLVTSCCVQHDCHNPHCTNQLQSLTGEACFQIKRWFTAESRDDKSILILLPPTHPPHNVQDKPWCYLFSTHLWTEILQWQWACHGIFQPHQRRSAVRNIQAHDWRQHNYGVCSPNHRETSVLLVLDAARHRTQPQKSVGEMHDIKDIWLSGAITQLMMSIAISVPH